MEDHTSVKKTVLIAVIIVLISFLVSWSQILYSFDTLISDPLYQLPAGVPDTDIQIVAIDSKTIDRYGDLSDWPRDIYTALVDILTADEDHMPAVIAFDMMFTTDRDPESDAAFAAACEKAGNVITGVDLVFRPGLSIAEDGSLSVDRDAVDMVEYPYAALQAVSSYGFVNAYSDRDQYIRYSRISTDFGSETIRSFPAAIYEKYCAQKGLTPSQIRTDDSGYFNFRYTARSSYQFGKVKDSTSGSVLSNSSGKYSAVSLCEILDGDIPADSVSKSFADKIVIVGVCAPGYGEEFFAPIQRGSGNQMYGVEIQANILQAIMEGRTALPINSILYACIAAFIALAYYLIIRKMKPLPAAAVGVGFIAVWLIIAKLLYNAGIVVRVIEPLLAVVILYVTVLGVKYLLEVIRRHRILNAFSKYVAPQVISEISSKGDFQIVLGGEKRHVAVLFVDIRGFTTMSEGLDPEEVVGILNEYLALTTNSIFKNNGTLDKFIGDATMAVFNAPFDLDDYVYRAVCTARDIAAGSEDLEKRLMERFGRSVSFGIGVNCGDAVVGNIGCDFRMDYTAIGDTVNTAARLESNARRGQILISQAVVDALPGRIRVSEVGAIPLKGKSNEVFVYQLDEVLDTPAPEGSAETPAPEEGDDSAC